MNTNDKNMTSKRDQIQTREIKVHVGTKQSRAQSNKGTLTIKNNEEKSFEAMYNSKEQAFGKIKEMKN